MPVSRIKIPENTGINNNNKKKTSNDHKVEHRSSVTG